MKPSFRRSEAALYLSPSASRPNGDDRNTRVSKSLLHHTGYPAKAKRLLGAVFVLFFATAAGVSRAQVSVVSNYSEDFDTIGTALPNGWGVWTLSTSSGNGTPFTWNTAQIANNAMASSTNYFRNIPGASQSWSASLSSGADRAIGWRAGDAASRDGSITFTFTNTLGWSFDTLSFQLFTPNSTGTAATFQFQYQIGATGTFTNFSPIVSYTNDTAQSPLIVTTITLTSAQLAPLANQSSQVTLRWDNIATSGTTWNTLGLDNFSYTATAIPEPSTYGAITGALALVGTLLYRRRSRRSGSPE
jgi:hypothetical protein